MADVIEIVVRAKDDFSGTLSNFGNIMTGLKSVIDMVSGGFQALTGFAMEGLDAISSYERLNVTLQTLAASQLLMTDQATNMNQALRMTSDTGKELLIWVQQLAIESPFTQQGVATAFQMAMAYGFNVEEAKRLTQAEIDYVAGTGQTEYAMERISRALGQISATGKLTGQDMLQLTAVGVPVAKILADYFGVTTAEIIKMRSEGLIPAQDAIEAITRWMETNFDGAAKKFTESWAGLTSTFSDLKQIGMREFFTGLFDALQPLAVEFSQWVQSEGFEKLREFGNYLGIFAELVISFATGGKLYELGAQLQELGGKGSLLEAVGTGLRIFQQAIDDGATARDAFIAFLDKFNQLTGLDIDTKFWVNLIFDFDASSLVEIAQKIDEALALQIRQDVANGKFKQSGDAFGDLIESLFAGSVDSADGTGLAQPLARAINQWLLGAMGIENWSEFFPTLGYALMNLFSIVFKFVGEGFWKLFAQILFGEDIDTFFAGVQGGAQRIGDFFKNAFYWAFYGIGDSLVDGLLAGFKDITSKMDQWAWDNIVVPIRKILGISSPSTVFMEIGINIVQGLVLGISSMINWAVAAVKSLILKILEPLKPLLELLGIDTTSIWGTSSTGTTGSRTPGTTDIRTDIGSTIGTSVVNNFYGPVYFGNLEPIGYDCPSPNPLVAASANTLLKTGIG